MPLSALALVVTAAFIHAYWNLLVKRAGGGSAFVWLFSFATAVLYAPVVAVLVWIEPLSYGALEWGLIASSGILHLLYAVTLNRGYRLADLSVVYPIARGTGPLISSVGAILLLGEQPGAVGALGIALIVIGILVIAGAWTPALYRASARAAKGLGYGIATGLCIAAYTLNDAYAVKVLLVSPIMIDYFGNLVRLAFLTPSVAANLTALQAEWRRNVRMAVYVGALMPLSYILSLFAMRLAPVSYVAPARELSMLVGAYFGAKLLQEGHTRQRIIGTALMIGGIVGLALSQ
ncbi:MAG TPA: DMT family transporter [Burkholderiales bacterium]|nr:DMT family transporter [Burkholderiales bacterium]